MRDHFLARGDDEMAARFRPSSMETIRALGGDPLTLVTKMPLFLTPGVGDEVGPPDRAAEEWKARIGGWRARLPGPKEKGAAIRDEATAAGLRPMPVTLQWEAILAGIRLVEGGTGP